MQNIKDVVEVLTADIEAMNEAQGIVKDKGQSIIVNLLWMVSEGHILAMPKLLTAFESSVRKLKLEREGFKEFIYQHIPLRRNDKDEWVQVNASSRKVMIKNRKKFREEFNNDYWLWVVDTVKVEKREVDWVARVDSAIKSAMDEQKGGMTQANLIKHIIENQGLDAEALLEILVPVEEAKAA